MAKTKKSASDDSIHFPPEVASWESELRPSPQPDEKTPGWFARNKNKLLAAGVVVALVGAYFTGNYSGRNTPGTIPTSTPTPIVQQHTPTQTLESVLTQQPTFTSTALPTNTLVPTATATQIPTEKPYNFCSNLEVSIQGFRVREQLPEMRDSIYSRIESEYGNKPTQYTLMNVLISAKDDMVHAEIVHNPMGGNPGVPEVYDLSYTPSEIVDFISMTGGPRADAVVLDSEAASKASSYIVDKLAGAGSIEVYKGGKTLTSGEISDLLEDLPEMLQEYTPVYITPLGDKYAIAIGDNYDIIVGSRVGKSLLDKLGMDTNCGY